MFLTNTMEFLSLSFCIYLVMGSFMFCIDKMLPVFIFYILLHASTSAMEYGYEREMDDKPEFSNYGRQNRQHRFDQILSNLHSLFKERATDNNGNSNSVDDYDEVNYTNKNEVKNEDDNKNEYNKRQFDEVLAEVTGALTKIKEELIKFNNDGVLTIESVKHGRRFKRELSNDTATNDTNTTKTEKNVTEPSTSTTTEKPTTTTVTEKVPAKNVTVKPEEVSAKNDTTDAPINSRRMMPNMPMMANTPEYVTTTSRVKDKLLSYLEDTFEEIERKLRPLTNIKIALSNDDHYRIGYIIATIDTLEVNLKKLRNDMNLHQHIWDDEKILDLFDRIKSTNVVATSLIESLKKYLPRN